MHPSIVFHTKHALKKFDYIVNHMAQWNSFHVVKSVILKFPADDL